jgi:hypothetical protein
MRVVCRFQTASEGMPFRLPWLALALMLAVAIALGWLLSPVLLWAYDVQRAGDLIERGMAWPEPRAFDSLPRMTDRAALDRALVLLDDATARRPAHPHAFRLLGQVRAARGELKLAADAFEQAAAWAPNDPLPRWEASLVYERMQRIVERAPRTPLLGTLASGELAAPGELVKSLFCNESGAASCYLGRTTFTLPYAVDPGGPHITFPALFLHPPASIGHVISIPADQPALRFVIGLDPAARGWRSDGAVFRVWVTPAGGDRQLAREVAVGAAMARRGWVANWADLSRWAGQQVTLTLESAPGSAGDAADDWYGWADLSLTSLPGAQYALLLPERQVERLRRGIQ